jgi:hypothetical protein
MALRKLPYSSVKPIVRRYLTDEGEGTTDLVAELRPARQRGYLRPSELEKVCRWKSPRALAYIKRNSPARVRGATGRALATKSEKRRLDALCELEGVSVPMASSILTLLDPKRYGVIDIRVWQLLHAVGAVTRKSKGVGFTFANWYQFLMIIRSLAKEFRVRARDVEWALFLAHMDYQKGVLYTKG